MPVVPKPGKPLTNRETELMNIITSTSFSAKTAARSMGISHRTVEVYTHSVIIKLQAKNLLHAALIWDRTARSNPDKQKGPHGDCAQPASDCLASHQ